MSGPLVVLVGPMDVTSPPSGPIGRDPGRPLPAGDPHRRWRAPAAARRPLRTEVARAVVDTDWRTPEAVVEAVPAAPAPRGVRS
ncbi:hypothetical protein [Streptomyces werraensis]|uniref:hypothetical protein n=1 Tax=Streptomyces werraensis TaxID=68284 RepID=UPI003700BDB0